MITYTEITELFTLLVKTGMVIVGIAFILTIIKRLW